MVRPDTIPSSSATPSDPIRAALAEFDKVEARCPYASAKPPSSFQDCPKCGASADEGCGPINAASYAFVKAVRSALSTGEPSPADGPLAALGNSGLNQ